MKKIALMMTGVLATALLLAACAAPSAQTEPTPTPTEQASEATEESADGALEFSITTLTGETLDQTVFSDHKLIMVNYWATWCGPCVSEIPDLVQISNDYADKGFALVGVLSGDDDIEGAQQFIADQGMTYPVVLPEDIFLDYTNGMYAIPTTLFFDSTGKQVGNTVVGAKSYEDWTGLIDLLLEQVS